jgi:hypothetical protein
MTEIEVRCYLLFQASYLLWTITIRLTTPCCSRRLPIKVAKSTNSNSAIRTVKAQHTLREEWESSRWWCQLKKSLLEASRKLEAPTSTRAVSQWCSPTPYLQIHQLTMEEIRTHHTITVRLLIISKCNRVTYSTETTAGNLELAWLSSRTPKDRCLLSPNSNRRE